MTISMTGFAAARGQGAGHSWAWDIRSVNGKGLDLRGTMIRDAMSANPRTIGPDHLAAEAVEIMERTKVTQLLVVDDEGRGRGLVGQPRDDRDHQEGQDRRQQDNRHGGQRDRQQQRRLLQPYLTRPQRRRSGDGIRSRRRDKLVRGSGAHRPHPLVGIERPRGAPHLLSSRAQGREAGREAVRGRSAAHLHRGVG